MSELNSEIGKHIRKSSDKDWHQHWPVVDSSGVVIGIVDIDSDIAGYTLLDLDKNGNLTETDGQHGFDAVLDGTGYLGA